MSTMLSPVSAVHVLQRHHDALALNPLQVVAAQDFALNEFTAHAVRFDAVFLKGRDRAGASLRLAKTVGRSITFWNSRNPTAAARKSNQSCSRGANRIWAGPSFKSAPSDFRSRTQMLCRQRLLQTCFTAQSLWRRSPDLSVNVRSSEEALAGSLAPFLLQSP